MPITFGRLDPTHHEHKLYTQKFNEGWAHSGKTGQVQAIYMAKGAELRTSYRGQRFGKYLKANGNEFKTLFHGTRRSCKNGDGGNTLQPCQDSDCYMCSVLNHSFQLKHARADGTLMFGPGIYSSPITSKADRYAMNHHVRSQMHAMFICRVVVTKPQRLTQADNTRTCPDPGFNCIQGLTVQEGGCLQFPEFVVYDESAIVPVGVIMYTRQGWTG
ncbi:unnamed protein product [Clonostachys rosea]|uniref:PARP catalytic domain-containing protein n=1 Tax=Bionectria ochroleuca TaxID=29856 RepID=A0ABY6U4V3_BIOOC|nr:unnamed protein product [Clonostachys rosea]